MAYRKFFLMIVVSTAMMFGLMYLNTYQVSHVYFSQTRAWMALLMGAAMAFVMLLFMWPMYPGRRRKLAILAASGAVAAVSLWFVRSQAAVGDLAWMRAMIPHHSIAILTSERASLKDPRVRKLAAGIVDTQRREIAEMEALIKDIDADQARQR